MFHRKLILTALFISTLFSASAQEINRFLKRTASNVYDIGAVKDYEGSPYLDDNFVESIALTNNSRHTGVLMRYNILDDNIEVKQSGVISILDPDMRLTKIVIGTTQLVVGKFEYKNKPQRGFLELLDSGTVSLFVKMVVEHKDKEEATPMKYNGAPERYIRNQDVFYYRIKGGNILKVDKVKSLLESLPEKKEEVSAFAKKEKIAKNKEDLVKLFRYYNSLFE